MNPNPKVKMFSANHGSAMGGAFGMGVGASLHTHKKSLHFFWRWLLSIYGGNLAEAANLNITLFVFNNMELSLVQHGCESIINDQESYHYHTNVNSVNWESIANGFNWNWAKVNPNLSNLDDIHESILQ